MTINYNSNISVNLGTMVSSIENLTLTGSGIINGTGNSLSNLIVGNISNNLLDGGSAGNDTLKGGAGNDVYIVNRSEITIVEALNQGIDLVKSSLSYTLGTNLDNLTLVGSALINGTGNIQTNVITGNSAANVLDGGSAGSDILVGGKGDDTYIVSHTGISVSEGLSAGIDLVQSSVTHVLALNVENLELMGSNAINGTGNIQTNIITGNSVANVISSGGGGLDTLIGAQGNDTYIITNTGVKVVENSAEGTDLVKASVNYTLDSNVENLLLNGTATKGSGNSLANVLTGNLYNNILDGGTAGSDTLIGAKGNDTYLIDRTGITITEVAAEGTELVKSSISYTLQSNVENLELTGSGLINGVGNSLINVITGNSLNNVLDGGSSGNDILKGGKGDDTYIVSHTGIIITEAAMQGTDLAQSGVSYTLALNVENLELTGSSTINGTGNIQTNIITGNSVANIIASGGGGLDTLIGGKGDDTYVVTNTGVSIKENSSEGIDLVNSSASYTLDANVENLLLSGLATKGTGNSLANILTGNLYNNVLDGGTAGSDTLIGAKGNDTYLIDRTGITIKENASEGTELVKSSISYTLQSNVENLTLTGSGLINGVGNSLINVITGNSLNNVLDGGSSGNDILKGGLGDDTYIVSHTGIIITETAMQGTDLAQSGVSYTLALNVENLELTGSSTINGTGNLQTNIITGNSVANILASGGGGLDTLIGGKGDDTYVVTNTGVSIKENSSEGTDLVNSSASYTLDANVENLLLTGTAIIGTGNSLVNVIRGNLYNNVLDGGTAGSDTLIGAKGNDTYLIDRTGITITEVASEGTELVKSSVSYTLQSNVENLTLTGSGLINGVGNSQINIITGNGMDNVLSGGSSGNDTLLGGIGDDTYLVDHTEISIVEKVGNGIDVVQASVSCTLAVNVENLTLLANSTATRAFGNLSDNVIIGNSLDNIIGSGGRGIDSLVGGRGNDTYVVTNSGVTITENSAEGVDVVQSTVSYTLDNNIENLILTGASTIKGVGNTQGNLIIGNLFANVLDGGAAGADTLIGGTGNDTYLVDRTGITLVEKIGEGNSDIVLAGINYTLAYDFENLTLTDSAAVTAVGNSLSNLITGNDNANIISGGTLGSDTLAGSIGDDTYLINHANTKLVEKLNEGADLVISNISFSLGANVEDLTLTGSSVIDGTGNSCNNTIIGNSVNNIIDAGSAGTDELSGGKGNDTYVISHTGVTVTENSAEGTDLLQSTISYTLDSNVENLLLTGISSINGTGNDENNLITGNSARNVLNGGDEGDDSLVGGLGNDTYIVSHTGINITELVNQGTDLVQSAVDFTLAAEIENLTLTGTATAAVGNNLTNVITGNIYDNIISGGSDGSDTLIGGSGNDTYVVLNTGVKITELTNKGTDLVESRVSYTLGNNLENLTLTGASMINGVGNSLTNIITGNSKNNLLSSGTGGNDTITSGAGNDTLQGGAGNDHYSFTSGDDLDLVNSDTSGTNTTGITDINKNNIAIYKDGSDLIISYASDNSDIITLKDYATSIAEIDDLAFNYLTQVEITKIANDINAYNLAHPGSVNSVQDVRNATFTDVFGMTLLEKIATEWRSHSSSFTGDALDNILYSVDDGNELIGLAGNDTYVIGHSNVITTEIAGEGTDLVKSSVDITLQSEIENLELTATATTGVGNSLANLITGNITNNVLDGGSAGADTLIGGLGDDTFVIDRTNITIKENSGEGTDLVEAGINYTLGNNTDNLTLTGSAINGEGNSLDNIITGNSLNNVMKAGTAGVDTLIGGLGNDQYMIDRTDVSIIENAGEGTELVISSIDYTLETNLENLTLTGAANIGTGNSLSNYITGNSLANVIDGDIAGDDVLEGRLGNDTYIINHTGVTVIEYTGEGTDLIETSISYTIANNTEVENLTLTGSGNIDGIGNTLANIITGNSVNNVLAGGTAGADTLIGGLGDDTFVIDRTNITIKENAGEDTDLVESSVSFTLKNNTEVENLTLTGTATIGTGNTLTNIITGNSVANVLNGGTAEIDTLIGGIGDDTYILTDAGAVIIENVGEGTDLVMASGSYSLGTNIENLTFTDTLGNTGRGNSLTNVITGNTNIDILDAGSAGDDSLIGGTGNDTYIVDHTGVTVTENAGQGIDLVKSSVSFTIANNTEVENLTLTGSGNIDGTGNTLANTITGNSVDNVLAGGSAGADTLIGGLGDDTFVIGRSNITIKENSGEGTDLVESSILVYTLSNNVENLTLTGTAINGTGNTLSNIITGNNLNNQIDGGSAGADTLIGGMGNDAYFVVNTSVIIIENAGQGLDVVQTDLNYTLGSNLENLILSGTAVIGTGNSLNNTLTGNNTNNVLDGGTAGNDVMNGSQGNDTYLVNHTGITINENSSEGTDLVQAIVSYTLDAEVENLMLVGPSLLIGKGNSLANIITANDGGDTLIGAAGNDTLTGGSGSDVYAFSSGDDLDVINAEAAGTNIVKITDIDKSNIAVYNSGSDLTLSYASDNTDEVTIKNYAGISEIDDNSSFKLTSTEITAIKNDIIAYNAAHPGAVTRVEDIRTTSFTDVFGGLTLLQKIASEWTYTGSGVITGDVLDNILASLADGNTLIGLAGNDTYIVNHNSVTITENAGEGTDLVISSVDHVLADNVENLTLTGAADIGVGNSLTNIITGNSRSNILQAGSDGFDTLIGGADDDSYLIDHSGCVIKENAGEGYDMVSSIISYTLDNNIEWLLMANTAAVGKGNSLANMITGNASDNIIDGGTAGADALSGKSGNDTYIVDHTGVTITENAGQGTDIVQSSVTFTLDNNVENLTLTGPGNINGTGNSLDNYITGNSGNNVLYGGSAGNDTLAGGDYYDTYIIDRTGITIIETPTGDTDYTVASIDYTLADNVENLTLTGSAIIGVGNSLINNITGNSLNNILDGGTAGADILQGGTGNDTFIVNRTNITVVENAGGGTDLVQSSINYTLGANVENLTLTGSAVTGVGNTLANIITGNALANILGAGTAGSDTLIGGLGDDYYTIDHTGVTIIENSSEGSDQVYSNISYTLGNNLETLSFSTQNNLIGQGNSLDNHIYGNGIGDTFIGGVGNDVYTVYNTSTVIIENVGEGDTDIVYAHSAYTLSNNIENLSLLVDAFSKNIGGNSLNNLLKGNIGSNVINGFAGNDTLDSDGGNDTLDGGTGDDVYVFSAGDDIDVINADASGTNKAIITDIDKSNIAVYNSGSDLIISYASDNADKVTMKSYAASIAEIDDNSSNKLTSIEIANIIADITAYNLAHPGAVTCVEDIRTTSASFTDVFGGLTLLQKIASEWVSSGGGTVQGDASGNVLTSTADNETMVGLAGNDTYIIDYNNVTVTENAGEGTDLVTTSLYSYSLGNNLENLNLTTGFTATGNSLSNLITTNASVNVIYDGGDGLDTLIGGADDDIYYITHTGVTIIELSSAYEGDDYVESTVSFTLPDYVESLYLVGSNPINGTGTSFDDVIRGNSVNNILNGGTGGNDQLYGEQGNDTYIVDHMGAAALEYSGEGTDLVQSSVSYTLVNNSEIENLTLTGTSAINGTGNSLANIITGNSAVNVLDGGTAGADTLSGNLGNDTYIVDHTGVIITENPGEGTESVVSAISYTLGNNLESLVLAGTAFIGAGNSSDNSIFGNNLDNYLNGYLGSDTLMGWFGNDTYIIDHTGVKVTESAGEGTDLVQSSINYTLGANVENLKLTGSAYIAEGNSLSNYITGNSIGSYLLGGLGNNTLIGGIGADTLYEENSTGNNYIYGDSGMNNISVSYSSGNNTIFGGANQDAINLRYSYGHNYIDAGADYDDIDLNMSSSSNIILCGAGDDYVFAISSSGNNYIDGGNDYDNFNLDHSVGNNTILGGSGNDREQIQYGAGNNYIDLGSGDDLFVNTDNTGYNTLLGGLGNDEFYIDTTLQTIIENPGEGTDLIRSKINYTLGNNVENLTLVFFQFHAANNGTGNSLDNYLTGNTLTNTLKGLAGNDTIDAGALGNDSLVGGTGNDVYIIDHTGVTVTEAAGEGTDRIQASASYTLANNSEIENLTLTGSSAINGKGNSLTNIITGNSTANVLDAGTAGADTLIGGLGNDAYTVDHTGVTIIENAGEGTDLVQSAISFTLGAEIENLSLTSLSTTTGVGNSLSNKLDGSSSDNMLDGGAAGNDTLAGSAGNDTYIVSHTGVTIKEYSGDGTDLVQSSISYTLDNNVENLTLTGTANIGMGNSLSNYIVGNSINSTLSGGLLGNDTIIGGIGADSISISYSTGNNYIVGGDGNEIISAFYSFGSNYIDSDLGNDEMYIYNNSGNNTIIGGDGWEYIELYFNTGNNYIDGGIENDSFYLDTNKGNNTISGGTGDDNFSIWNGTGNNILNGDAGEDYFRFTRNLNNNTILGGTEDDYFNCDYNTGNNYINGEDGEDYFYFAKSSGNNILNGENGNDTILVWLNTGSNTLIGGLGDDTYIVYETNVTIVENTSEGTDTVQTSLSNTLSTNIENLILTGANAISGTGNSLDNYIIGNSNNNNLDGGSAGADTLIGGLGDDLYNVGHSGVIIIENPDEGTGDQVVTSVNYTLGNNIESMIITSTAVTLAVGNSSDNIIQSPISGNQTLIGGLGNDSYNIMHTNIIIIEYAGEGIDLVNSFDNYTLSNNIENLSLLMGGIGVGNSLNNVITGGGASTMAGGLGNDTYVINSATAVITENAGQGTDLVQSSVSYTLGANVENLTLSGSAVYGVGTSLTNIIIGNSLANVLNDGTAGSDTLVGGLGDDTYIINTMSASIIENSGEGTDVLYSAYSCALSFGIENGILTGGLTANVTGNSLDNYIIGNSNVNYLVGNNGNDILDSGTAGADTLEGGYGNDTFIINRTNVTAIEVGAQGYDLVISSVSYTISNEIETLTLTGGSVLIGQGNIYDNVLTPNSVSNTLKGLAGNDTYIINHTGVTVTENASEGTDLVEASISYTLGSNVENLRLTGSAVIGYGNALVNIIIGNSVDNILNAATGATDTLMGGLGNDTYTVDTAGAIVIENAGEGIDLIIQSVNNFTPIENIENITLTGTAFTASGNTLDNIITGNNSNNWLDAGLGGADTLIGGLGNDTFYINHTGVITVENTGEGTDMVMSDISYTLSAEIENLTLNGAAIYGTGNVSTNIITGNNLANVIDAGIGGNDTLIGGTGNDTYIINHAFVAAVKENAGEGTDIVYTNIGFILSANLENITLTGSADVNAIGNSLDNYIIGNNGSNLINAFEGNDVINSGGGADNINGGDGNDTYILSDTLSTITDTAGTDLVEASVSYTLGSSLENLTLMGSAVIGNGNALVNIITGNNVANVLDGGTAGADTLIGGLNNDTYIIDHTGITITEVPGEGTDLTQSSIDYTLSYNVENLNLVGAAVRGMGNSCDNTITGNSLNNYLIGYFGADTLIGGTGNDTYVINNSSYTVVENTGEGTDLVQASVSYTLGANIENLNVSGLNVIATGNNLDNIINGSANDDTIRGGLGNDTLYGNFGADTFLFSAGDDIDILNGSSEGPNTLIFDDVNKSNIAFYKSGTDLIMSYAADNTDKVTYKAYATHVPLIKDNSGYSLTAALITSIISDITAYNAVHVGEVTSVETVRSASYTDVFGGLTLMQKIASEWV